MANNIHRALTGLFLQLSLAIALEEIISVELTTKNLLRTDFAIPDSGNGLQRTGLLAFIPLLGNLLYKLQQR